MDPAERERCDVMQWLNQCIDTLNIQVDVDVRMYWTNTDNLLPTDNFLKSSSTDLNFTEKLLLKNYFNEQQLH